MATDKLIVLAYHRIDTPDGPANRDLSPALIDAAPAEFEAQMRWVAGRYNVISGWQLVDSLRNGKPLPPRALMITFDDGYNCFMETAVPILRRYGLPATLFVPTEYISNPGRPLWWDTLHRVLNLTGHDEIDVPGAGRLTLRTAQERSRAYETLVAVVERTDAGEASLLVERIVRACGVEPSSEKHRLGWQEIGTLAEAGDITIGPHTRRHPILSRTSAERMKDEVEGSWGDLREQVARPLPLFAYPNGQPHAISQANIEAVRRAGLAGAFSMIAGHNTPGTTNPYMMHRLGVSAGLSLTRFKLRVSSLGVVLRHARAVLRGQRAATF